MSSTAYRIGCGAFIQETFLLFHSCFLGCRVYHPLQRKFLKHIYLYLSTHWLHLNWSLVAVLYGVIALSKSCWRSASSWYIMQKLIYPFLFYSITDILSVIKVSDLFSFRLLYFIQHSLINFTQDLVITLSNNSRKTPFTLGLSFLKRPKTGMLSYIEQHIFW